MEQHIAIRDTYMNVISFGKGSKNLTVIAGVSLTGLEGMGDAVEDTLSVLAQNFKVYVFDNCKVLPKGHSTEDMAEDIYQCLKKLGVEHTYVYGVSHGGMIGQMLTINHPELVDKLVLCSTISRYKGTQFDIVDKWLEAAQKHDVESVNRLFIDNVYSEAYIESIKDIIPALLKNGSAEDCERFAILAEAIKGFDSYDLLDRIKCPVYVICDKNDRVVGDEPSRELADKLQCKIHVYDQYSHAVYDEAPDLKERIRDFFLA